MSKLGCLPSSPTATSNSLLQPHYHSRNLFDYTYDPDAECPKFLDVLNYALPQQEDVSLFLRWFGGCLIQGNPAQKIMLLCGEAKSSKSLLLTVVESILGERNVATLRTHLLHERFELARLSGKVLLTAKDIDGDFLQHDSAQVIKSLCGGDRQVGEFKGSMTEIPVSGDYHIGISSNEKLLVRLRGKTDADAWARRIMLLKFEHPVKMSSRITTRSSSRKKERASSPWRSPEPANISTT